MSVATAAPAGAAAAPIDPDAELVALAERIERLHPAIVEASKRLEEAGERYEAIKPERSQVLNWRPADAGLVSRYSNASYVTDESIEALRGQEFVEWEFTGPDEELEQLGPMWVGTSLLPIPGHEHRFVSRPDERRQRRTDELISALDEYRANNDAAINQAGLRAAEDALEALQDERDEIADEMLKLRPKTLRGLQALATGLVYAEWSGDIRHRPKESLEDELLNVIIRALTEDKILA